MARTFKPIKSNPEYNGAEAFRSSRGEKLLCRRCARLAQFRAYQYDENKRIDLFFCEPHVNQAIIEREIRKVAPLKEWTAFQRQLTLWNEQEASSDQVVLFP